ncbi:MAG TPA: hypothetical protein VFB21_02085 [Chthonomonadaceae bacterium]|nr:hypothetical protein [Chthonomonadaceae bacterium]
MRTPLLIAAIVIAVGSIGFVIWSGQASRPVADEAARTAFVEELHSLRGQPVPPEMQDRARKLGADPETARRELAAAGYTLDPNAPQVWGQAVSKPVKEADERGQKYGAMRIPVLIGGFGLALLLVALANRPQAATGKQARARF